MKLTQLCLTMRIWLRILRCIVTRTPMTPPPCGCRLGKGGRCGDIAWRPAIRRIRCFDCWYRWQPQLRPMVWRVELRERYGAWFGEG